jgi:copper chaperone CopZ
MQTVELKVSMHCNGCAKKVQKHISRMEGNKTSSSFSFFYDELLSSEKQFISSGQFSDCLIGREC